MKCGCMLPTMLAEALHLLLQLGYVYLSDNTLEGSLPPAWGNLTNVSLVIALMHCYKCTQLVYLKSCNQVFIAQNLRVRAPKAQPCMTDSC